MGFLLALVLAAALAVLAALNAHNTITLDLVADRRLVLEVWELVLGTALASAFVAWISSLRSSWRLKREIRRRDQELKDVRQRLDRAHDSLQEYETRMHEFALSVVRMAHRQLPPSPEEAAEELVESFSVATPAGGDDLPAAAASAAPAAPTEAPAADDSQSARAAPVGATPAQAAPAQPPAKPDDTDEDYI